MKIIISMPFLLGDTTIVVTGTGFGGLPTPETVTIGDKEAEVLKEGYAAGSISVKLPSLSPGTYDLMMYVPEKGHAAMTR